MTAHKIMSIIELETNRGKRSISCDYYRYRIDHHDLRGGDISWRCTQKRCKARIRTDEALTKVFQRKNKHCHEADQRKTERQILRVRSKRKAVEDANEKPSKIMCSELKRVEKKLLHPRDLKSVTQAMYRERRRQRLLPSNNLAVKFPVSKPRDSGSGSIVNTINEVNNDPAVLKIIKREPVDVHDIFERSEAAFCLREEAVKSQQSSAVDLAQSRVTRLGPKNVDIMQILSGAQQRYENKTKGGLEPINISTSTSVSSGVAQIIKPTPLKLPDGSSSNGEGPSQLQALFKNVKLTQQLQQRPGGMVDQYAGDPPPDVTINPFHNEGWSSCRSLSVTEVESGAQSISSAPTGGLTVEEIERQQREQIQTVIAGDQVQAQGAEGGISQVQSTKELLHLITASAGGDGHVGTLPAMPQFYPTSTCDKGSKEATVLSAESNSGRPAELLTPSDFGKQLLIMPAIPKEAAGIGQPCPDVLLTPLAFVTPQRPASSSISPSTTLNPTALLEQLNNIQRRSPASPGFASPPPAEITPLTRQQLQQALIYIIRTDEDFVSRLHEAYLASFQQQLAGSSTSKR